MSDRVLDFMKCSRYYEFSERLQGRTSEEGNVQSYITYCLSPLTLKALKPTNIFVDYISDLRFSDFEIYFRLIKTV